MRGVVVSCLFLLVGCGGIEGRLPVEPVRGKVSFRGKAPAGAIVRLHPKNASIKLPDTPRGIVEADGTFVISTYEKHDGAPVGEYVVTAEWRPPIQAKDGETTPGANQFPARLQHPATSDLRAVVTKTHGGNELPPIEIK